MQSLVRLRRTLMLEILFSSMSAIVRESRGLAELVTYSREAVVDTRPFHALSRKADSECYRDISTATTRQGPHVLENA